MSGKAGKKTNFYIGYLRNENILILLNAYYNMGLFIKIVETGFPHTQAGWRQIRDEDIEDYRDGVDVLCYTGNYGRCPVSCFEVLEEAEADDFEDLDYRNTYLDPHGKEWRNNGWIDREGHTYPCEWMQHDDLAYYYFKKTVSEMEAAGWIRVTNGVPGYRGRISQAQYNKCMELGIEIPEYNVLWQ